MGFFMATREQEVPYHQRTNPEKEKNRILKAGWSNFVHGLVEKGVEAAKKMEGVKIYGKDSISVLGFIFLRRDNQTIIKPLYSLEQDEEDFCFTISQREVDKRYVFESEEVIGLVMTWNEEKQEWEEKEVKFPVIKEKAFNNFLTKGRKRKGYLLCETIWRSFFEGLEEKPLVERIEILKKAKRFCQLASPVVYETKCAEYFSRIK